MEVGGIRLIEEGVSAIVGPDEVRSFGVHSLAFARNLVDDNRVVSATTFEHGEGRLEVSSSEVSTDALLNVRSQFEGDTSSAALEFERALGFLLRTENLGVSGESDFRGLLTVVFDVFKSGSLEEGLLSSSVDHGVHSKNRLEKFELIDISPFNITNTDHLEEVTTKGETGIARGFVAGGDPSAATHHHVSTVHCWDGEIVVERMNTISRVGIGRSFEMLPDIANDVEERTVLELVDRAGGGPLIIEVDVARRSLFLPLTLIDFDELVPHDQPFTLSGEAEFLAELGALPVAEGLGFEVVDFARPVPRKRDFIDLSAELEDREASSGVSLTSLDPEPRMLRLLPLNPIPSFLIPPLLILVATVLDKFEELSVRDEVLGSGEGFTLHGVALGRVVTIPTVVRRVRITTNRDVDGFFENFDELVARSRFAVGVFVDGVRSPELTALTDIVEGQLAEVDRSSFDVDAFVFDTHVDGPEEGVSRVRSGVVEVEREWHAFAHSVLEVLLEHLVDHDANLRAISPDISDGWPVVVCLVQVVPTHLIDTSGEHFLELGVHALSEAGDGELVGVEGGSVSEVEDQGMAELVDGRNGVRFITNHVFEDLFEEFHSDVEVLTEFFTALAALNIRGRSARTFIEKKIGTSSRLEITSRVEVEESCSFFV
jgi:hypothetical protein